MVCVDKSVLFVNFFCLKKADLAVAALTINYQREQAIDFTKPFLNTGISILFKRPEKKTPDLFSFLYPLSIDIWLYMIAAYLGNCKLIKILRVSYSYKI